MNTQVFKSAQHIIAENSAALLTGTGVVGVVTTAVLASQATLKFQRLMDNKEATSIATTGVYVVPGPMEQLKLAAPFYAPAVASGVTTISAIVFSYRISASKSAALAAAYGISEKAFSDYKEKVMEHITPRKAEDIKDGLAKKTLDENPPPAANVMIIGEGEVLCLDSFSGQYFRCTMEKLRKAENDINADIGAHNVASLGDFYEKIGLKQTDISESFAWSLSNHCEIDYSTQLTDDGRPCLVIQFTNAPRPTFDDIHPYA